MADPKRPGSRMSSARKRLLALVMGIVGSLLFAEFALRIHNPIGSPIRAHGIVLPAHKTFVTRVPANPKRSDLIRVQFNSMGFRGPERPVDYKDLRSILAIGGSTTACVGLTDGCTWPDHLRRLLDARGPTFWINNAGFVGHSTFGHLILLREYVVSIAPDYVLMLVGVNDVGREDLNDWDVDLRLDNASMRDKILRVSELALTVQTLYRAFRAFDLGVDAQPNTDFATIQVYNGRVRSRDELLSEHSEFLSSFGKRLEMCVEICARADIRPVFMTQPALYGDMVDPTTGVELGRLDFAGQCSASEQWRTLELYNDVSRRIGRARQVPVIDLARKMPKDSRYYFDWIHYSLEGAVLVANLIDEELIRIMGE